MLPHNPRQSRRPSGAGAHQLRDRHQPENRQGTWPDHAAGSARGRRQGDRIKMLFAAMHESGCDRLCCKSLFAPVIKNSPGCRRDFRVKMWGTSSRDDKFTGDLGSVIETTQIGGRRSDRLMAGKLSPGNFRLLQQYLPEPTVSRCSNVLPNSLDHLVGAAEQCNWEREPEWRSSD